MKIEWYFAYLSMMFLWSFNLIKSSQFLPMVTIINSLLHSTRKGVLCGHRVFLFLFIIHHYLYIIIYHLFPVPKISRIFFYLYFSASTLLLNLSYHHFTFYNPFALSLFPLTLNLNSGNPKFYSRSIFKNKSCQKTFCAILPNDFMT